MRLPIYVVDAFTDRRFGGNPAAVCPLEEWLPDRMLQDIAAENNLAETAFFLPERDGYALRWFTPTVEVDLCGHATLAAAFIILTRLEPRRDQVIFSTREAGLLTVTRQGDRLALDFPARRAVPVEMLPTLAAALGHAPAELHAAQDYLAVYRTAEEVAGLAPDIPALTAFGRYVIVTAPGADGIDFVSRFFAPAGGIPEDPVTGRAHCTLVPYWAARLGKTALEARQISRRGGALSCALAGDRVSMAGQAVLYLEGTISV